MPTKLPVRRKRKVVPVEIGALVEVTIPSAPVEVTIPSAPAEVTTPIASAPVVVKPPAPLPTKTPATAPAKTPATAPAKNPAPAPSPSLEVEVGTRELMKEHETNKAEEDEEESGIDYQPLSEHSSAEESEAG